MSLYTRQKVIVTTEPVTTIIPEPGEQFINNHGIIIILILIMIIAIIAIWLFGSKYGDTVTDGKKLPTGFPLYIIRNVFSTLSIILIGLGIYFVSRNNQDFNSGMLILLYVVLAVTTMLYEAYFQIKSDPSTAALVLSLGSTAILFMIFLSWDSPIWVKFFFFIPFVWFFFLVIETLAYSHINGGTGIPI